MAESPSHSGVISYFDYHDLTQRIGVVSVDGGRHLRGSATDVQIVDAEPALHDNERELARIAGVFTVIGARRPAESSEATLGLVMETAATIVVTSERLIALAIGGSTQQGTIANGKEVHTFALPWDLVDEIAMPARAKMGDRIAGGRTIELFNAATMMVIRIIPRFQEGAGGARNKLRDDDAFGLLVRAAAAHRWSVSPEHEQARLQAIIDGRYTVADGEIKAELTHPDNKDVPLHLAGRLAGAPEPAPQPQPAPPDAAPVKDARTRIVLTADEL